ncbi:hypothetical protein FJT64_009032 [Amphibalanus amphitrite]|uniref:Uncharacterized protein n=1 Tax=Amphibalanus amphitrite TaxID=1232801 RepID=A0A6A4VGI7_AMPAM|nr:hypothetical protein FJT64_009032 [Amphibalanus amphitrite]
MREEGYKKAGDCGEGVSVPVAQWSCQQPDRPEDIQLGSTMARAGRQQILLLLATLASLGTTAPGEGRKGDGGALSLPDDRSLLHLAADSGDGAPQQRTYDLVPAATGYGHDKKYHHDKKYGNKYHSDNGHGASKYGNKGYKGGKYYKKGYGHHGKKYGAHGKGNKKVSDS